MRIFPILQTSKEMLFVLFYVIFCYSIDYLNYFSIQIAEVG